MTKAIYFDYAAATPMDEKVLAAMRPYFSDKFYNPSATYLVARDIRAELSMARRQVAGILGAKPAEIIFTAGATEANNLAIQGLMRQFPDGGVLISAIEHESVSAPAALFGSRTIPVDKHGLTIVDKLQEMINPRTVLVSAMLVNNELATIQPLKDIAQLIKTVRLQRRSAGNSRPLYFHTDAAQAANFLDLHVSRLGVDLMSLNGGKIYGPKQSGVLFIRAGVVLSPLIVGGGQEFGLRSGTENIAAAIGFTKALELAQSERAVETRRLAGLRDEFEAAVLRGNPQARINCPSRHRTPHISSITFPGIDNERLIIQLDEAGVQVAAGSACSASSEKPSHVLAAIGLSDSLARSTLRFSFGRQTTPNNIRKLSGLLVKLTAVK